MYYDAKESDNYGDRISNTVLNMHVGSKKMYTAVHTGYSGFFSRENIFTNFAALCLSAKKFFVKILDLARTELE